MNYGLHLSASGVLTNMYRQDVFANNLANVTTAGFKRDLAGISQRQPESIEGNHPFDVHHALLDRLNGGVFAGPQRISFERGPLERTDNPLDVALLNDETFFAVAETDRGQQVVRLTRDGRFDVSGEGLLVMAISGNQVLDENDQSISVDRRAGQVTIDEHGRVRQNGDILAQLQMTGVADAQQLRKAGRNLFRFADNADGRTPAANARVEPGHIEASGIDPFTELRALMDASGAVQSNANLIKYHDLLMDRAVNTLGRVVA